MKAFRLLVATAALLLAWGWTHAGGEFVDLGDGLLLRADGEVIAAWDLPECHMDATAYDAQAVLRPLHSPSVITPQLGMRE